MLKEAPKTAEGGHINSIEPREGARGGPTCSSTHISKGHPSQESPGYSNSPPPVESATMEPGTALRVLRGLLNQENFDYQRKEKLFKLLNPARKMHGGITVWRRYAVCYSVYDPMRKPVFRHPSQHPLPIAHEKLVSPTLVHALHKRPKP